MRKVRSRDTAPEIIFRKALWANGLRYRICVSGLPGKPDVVLPSKKLAIFIDGDFWHGNQWRKRGLLQLEEQFRNTEPVSREYWLKKIRKNVHRDCDVTAQLLSEGWTVIRFWESRIHKDLEGCVQMTLQAIRQEVVPAISGRLAGRTVAEFFAGIGLMRMGLEEQGWVVTFANDIDADKEQIYLGHFGDDKGNFVRGDIHDLAPGCIPPVTLATASFPCNDLSLAGARAGLAGKQSSAFWGFTRLLESMGDQKPPLLLIENVPGFLSSHGGEDFRSAMLALNDLGYSVDPFILDAANFVPQSRRRLFIVGVLDCLGLPQVRDRPVFYESAVRPKALADVIFTEAQIRWNIRPLPPPPQCQKRLVDILNDVPEEDQDWWSDERSAYLLNQMSSIHREIANRMIDGEEYSFGTVFRRVRHGKSMAELRTDGFAGCLRTPRGGSGRQILFRAGKGRYFARLLTPRECARLMGADEYQITAPPNQALFGFGDAVCVPVISWIGENYLNPLVNELLHDRLMRAATSASRYQANENAA